MEGVNRALVEELLKESAGIYVVGAAFRGPDFSPADGLKWVFTAFIRRCLLGNSLRGRAYLRGESLSGPDVSCFIGDVQVLLRKTERRKDVWVDVNHYLGHITKALRALKECAALSEERREEAAILEKLIWIIETHFVHVYDGEETANLASTALEATVVAWYETYSKR